MFVLSEFSTFRAFSFGGGRQSVVVMLLQIEGKINPFRYFAILS